MTHSQLLSEIREPKVLGIDDWTYRKGVSYGTILIDMETSKSIDISGATTGTQVIAGCSPCASPSGTQMWITTGVYFDTIPNNSSCDSLMTIYFSVIAADNATFNLSPSSDRSIVISEVLPEETYSFNITPGDDAVINPVTKTITKGTAGESYEVLYTTNGTCPSSSLLLMYLFYVKNHLFR